MNSISIWLFMCIGIFSANLCSHACFGEKILVVVFVSTKSHKLTYMPLIEELGKRGHNITVLSPIKPTKQMKNVHEILTIDAEKLTSFVMDPFKIKEQNINQQPFTNIEWFSKVCRDSYDLPQVKEVMEESFDLIFLQPMLNECVLGLVHKINAPLVLFSPVAVPNFLADRFGNHFPRSIIPNVFSGFPTEMNFYQRFMHFGFDVWLQLYVRIYYQPAMQAIIHEKVGKDIPSIDEMLSNASLILSNGHFSLHNHKPLLPNIVEVGGLHSRPPKPLSKDLDDFITRGNEGFIYFSMGSAIKAHTMPEEKRQMFVNVFRKLKQQVIWKWETEIMSDLPPNVKLHKFLPQQDILGHKNIKMFISHCGGGSTEESIYHAVPIIALPMFGDQPQNAKFAKSHGLVIELDWNEITEEQLSAAIHEILNNPKYQDNANKISAIYKDQPDKPLDRGAYWIEYIMRHKGAVHLHSVGRKLNFLQFHSIDVIATYFLIFVISTLLICKLVSWILCSALRCCGSKSRNEKSKSE